MAYFWIRSRLNGLVLDVEGGNRNPGARVILWNQKPGLDDNQLWYEDVSTGTIRSKLNGLCLDLAGDTLVLQPYYYGNHNQQWMRADPYIQNRVQPHRVIDVANSNANPGAHLIAWNRHTGVNQMFDFNFASGGGYPPAGPSYPSYPAAPAPPPSVPVYPPSSSVMPGRHFFLVSELHGKVLDIEGAKRLPGADLITWPRKLNCRNQLWYIDAKHNILRSSFNDFVPESRANGEQLRMVPFTGQPWQRWTIQGNRIVHGSNTNECMDIQGANQRDGAKIIQWTYSGASNQHWRIEYV